MRFFDILFLVVSLFQTILVGSKVSHKIGNKFSTKQHSGAIKTDVYKYSAEVKAEVYQPIQYESSSRINGYLLMQCETAVDLSKICIMVLENITVSAHNGRSEDKNPEKHILNETKKDIGKPFQVSYNIYGQFKGAKFVNDDSSWSKNVKSSIASALQYNSTLRKNDEHYFSFFNNENTIHGNCRISNDVKTTVNEDKKKVVTINKNYIPKFCGEYPREYFDTNFDKCFRQIADDNISSAKKQIEIQVKEDSEKLMRYEGQQIETYMPYLHKSDALIVRTKQTLNYEKTLENQELLKSSFNGAQSIKDATYKNPITYITAGGRDDTTQGRRNFGKADPVKVIEMLEQSYDYLNSDRFEKKDSNAARGDSINKIAEYLVTFDNESFKKLWAELSSMEPSEKTEFMKKILVDIVSHVGTEASSTHIRDVVQTGNISDAAATDILAQFPQYVLEPKEKLLHDMKVLLNLNENVSHDVKKAAILSFATLVYRTYENYTQGNIPQGLEKHLQYFNDKLKESIDNNDTEMILVYIMAFQNIRVGHIERFLWPILRKDIKIQTDGDRIRVATALVIFSGIQRDTELVHNVYFPIITDENEYLPLRAISLLRLIFVTQVVSQRRPMETYWQYVNETNPAMRNLHSSIFTSYANFGTPCRQSIREDYEKIVRFTELEKFNFSMPSLRFVDNAVNKYAFGEAMIEYILKTNENTGLTDIGTYFWNIADGRKPGPFVQLYWMFERIDEVILDALKYFLKDTGVQSTLEKYQLDESSDASLTLIPFYGFQVAQVYHYTKKSSVEKKERFWKEIEDRLNSPTIFFSELKESSAGSDLGVPDFFGHYEPNLLSKNVDIEATAEESTVNMKLKILLNMWSHGAYDLSIYNSIADIFHTVRRSTAIDATLPMTIDVSYDLEAKTLKVFAPKTSEEKILMPKLLTYSKTYTIMDGGNDNFTDFDSVATVTKGEAARETHQYTFESNQTRIKYNMDIYDCETGFNPELDKEEWREAISNPDRFNILGPTLQEFWAAKHKLAVDMMSPRPGICGVLREYLPVVDSSFMEFKLGEK